MAIEKIVITRGEGFIDECGIPNECETFADAYFILRSMSNTAPKDGGYDKCDFTIDGTWGADNKPIDYSGRYDLKHWSIDRCSLKEHVMGFIGFHTGDHCPAHMTQKDYDRFISTINVDEREEHRAFYAWIEGQL